SGPTPSPPSTGACRAGGCRRWPASSSPVSPATAPAAARRRWTCSPGARSLDLLDDARLQLHLTEALHPGVDVVAVGGVDQPDVAHGGPGLDRLTRALDLEGPDHGDGIAVGQ